MVHLAHRGTDTPHPGDISVVSVSFTYGVKLLARLYLSTWGFNSAYGSTVTVKARQHLGSNQGTPD